MIGGQEPSAHSWPITQLTLTTGSQPAPGPGACLRIRWCFKRAVLGTRRDLVGGWKGLPWLEWGSLRCGCRHPHLPPGPPSVCPGSTVSACGCSCVPSCHCCRCHCLAVPGRLYLPSPPWIGGFSSSLVQEGCFSPVPGAPRRALLTQCSHARLTALPIWARCLPAGHCPAPPGTQNRRRLSFWPTCGVTRETGAPSHAQACAFAWALVYSPLQPPHTLWFCLS